MFQMYQIKVSLISTILFLSSVQVHCQKSIQDSLIKKVMNQSVFNEDEGLQLIRQGKYEEAGSVLNEVLKRNDLSKDAYMKRGIVNWQLQNAEGACRDWSAVLALGDTATFKLLDSQCNGNMLIGEDTVKKDDYRKLFASNFNNDKSNGPEISKVKADVMPQFKGGDEALYRYLKDNLKMPESAKQKKINGRVYINFVIDSQGKVQFPYVVRGLGHGCDDEALRLVKNMPAWTPGKTAGKPVLVRYNIPVKFSNP
ncbi:MAG: TonB family protein [Bacteroidetes bacterium]|nr:MAG: TonB family protein [Bacteroidota bacterium]REK00930.1 MAG: TonB family protein [Bacteroidota bacterium]REK34533.1 MAG: TonB family protein [Bacteroidota bacterium]REK51791.1 MAG: TonB family protein [Bacteroidota bacterium]